MKLVIVESPAKCKTIESYLGKDWCVTASYGHISDLPEKNIGVNFTTYRPSYEISTRSKKTVSKLKKLAKEASEIYIATDLDREGEAIAKHIAKILNIESTAKRITFNEITPTAVISAIQKPRKINIAMCESQEARRVLDRLVGYQVSWPLSQLAGLKLSAGRVQSVAVKLVSERCKEIDEFKSTTHYIPTLYFDDNSWSAELDTSPHVNSDSPYITNKNTAEALLNFNDVYVSGLSTKNSIKNPPGPFMTDTLQQAASINLKLSPAETMKHAQILFDNGLITYHRTDSPNLSSDGTKMVHRWLNQNGNSHLIPENVHIIKSSEEAQEAHEAIRPTNIDLTSLPIHIESQTKDLYELIKVRTIASQTKAAIFSITNIEITPNANSNSDIFTSKFTSLLEAGWKEILSSDNSEDTTNDELSDAPLLNEGQTLFPSSKSCIEKKTRSPKFYSEASLVKSLKSNGVGRPSTYASILQVIRAKGYIEGTSQKIKTSNSGNKVVNLLSEFDFMNIEFTKNMELELDKISKGKAKYFDTIDSLQTSLKNSLESLRRYTSHSDVCPKCGSSINKIHIKDKTPFWSCSKWNDGCSFKATDDNGSLGKEIIEYLSDCVLCNKTIIRRYSKTKKFYFWVHKENTKSCKQFIKDKERKPDFEES